MSLIVADMQVQERVQVFWVRRSHLHIQRLSSNILREMCRYLKIDCFLPFFNQGHFGLVSVFSKTCTRLEGTEFPSGAMLCYVSKTKVMRLGGEKRTLMLSRKKAVQVADMIERRYFPGVIRYGCFVYAFGGLKAAVSSEKYSLDANQWSGLPLMAAAKSAFTPVLLGGLIYLPEVNEGSNLLEVFDIERQQFSSIAPSLPFTDFASIAFIYRGELVILDDTGRRARLPLFPLGEFDVDEIGLGEVECYAQSGPVVVGRAVYFVQYSYGELCKFYPYRNAFRLTTLN